LTWPLRRLAKWLKAIDRRNPSLRGHALGWNDYDLSPLFQDQLANIVEQIVDFRVREIAKINAP
jgi:recombinational DNA repair ATPase RecF